MILKYAMLKSFEYALDNEKKNYDDIFVCSEKNNIVFSIFDKSYEFASLKSYYDDNSDTSFEVFVTIKKKI